MKLLNKLMHSATARGAVQGAVQGHAHRPGGYGYGAAGQGGSTYAPGGTTNYGGPVASNPYGSALNAPGLGGAAPVGGYGQPRTTGRDITVLYDRRSTRELGGGATYGQPSSFAPANMFGGVPAGGASAQDWDFAQQAVMHLAEAAKQVDPDGISLYVYSDDGSLYQQGEGQPQCRNNLTSKAQTRDVLCNYQPQQHTPMHKVLDQAFANFWSNRASNQRQGKSGEIFFVLTDGAPDDETSVYRSIANMTQQMARNNVRDEEVGLLFLQIGNDPQASRFLWELDNNMRGHGAMSDIVDAKKVSDLQGIPLAVLMEQALCD